MARNDKAGSQQWTAVSSLLGLVSTVQRRCVTQTHINCKMTRSLYQAWFSELTCVPNHALLDHVFRGRKLETKCHDWCLEKRKNKYISFESLLFRPHRGWGQYLSAIEKAVLVPL